MTKMLARLLMIQPARLRRGILRGAGAAAGGEGWSAGLEGVGMVRLGWVQHLMAGLWVARDSAEYRGLSTPAAPPVEMTRFIAAAPPVEMTNYEGSRRRTAWVSGFGCVGWRRLRG
jgi:hypothetical protein